MKVFNQWEQYKGLHFLNENDGTEIMLSLQDNIDILILLGIVSKWDL